MQTRSQCPQIPRTSRAVETRGRGMGMGDGCVFAEYPWIPGDHWTSQGVRREGVTIMAVWDHAEFRGRCALDIHKGSATRTSSCMYQPVHLDQLCRKCASSTDFDNLRRCEPRAIMCLGFNLATQSSVSTTSHTSIALPNLNYKTSSLLGCKSYPSCSRYQPHSTTDHRRQDTSRAYHSI